MILFLSNSKISKVISSILTFVIIFNNIIFPTRAFALSGGPAQIEFASFDSAASSEMVNLFTGDFAYNIPLLDIDGYPVNIAYHASPSMDQEASWVGLGWNINAGAINRSMRGLPDDFNGDQIKKEINIKDYKAWGAAIGYFGEFAGLKLPLNVNIGVGVFHTNYTGYGIEPGFDISASVGKTSNHMQGALTMGLGVKLNSQDGMNIYPQVGVSAKLSNNKRIGTLGVNVGAAINSRSGLQSMSGGYSLSLSKKGQSVSGNNPVKNEGKGLGMGKGFGTSSSIPSSSQGTMPHAFANMKSRAFSYDFKIGGNTCMYAMGGYINGYFANNKFQDDERKKSFNSYGYLYSQNATENDLLDFNREKDGVIYPEIPNLPIANFTYDMFSANAQGLSFAFRPHRNDIGVLHDNATNDNSFGLGLGGELMFSTDVNVGINISVTYSKGESGNWDDDNDMKIHTDFTNFDFSQPNYEASYFKVAGEKLSDDAAFLNEISNAQDDAYRVKIGKKTNTKYYATNEFVTKYDATSGSVMGAFPLVKSDRAKRNNNVSYLDAFEASKFGLNKTIQSYPEINSSKLIPSYFDNSIIDLGSSSTEISDHCELNPNSIANTARDGAFSGTNGHHLSEMILTQDNGARYVYGIPLYTREQSDVTFNVGNESINNANVGADGLINFASGADDNISNSHGIDNFFERNTMPDYSNGFLLTSILSNDYVDRTGNGPSNDDYGDYTKFNYTNVAGKGGAAGSIPEYNWRMPMTQTTGQANFNQALLGDKKDNKGVYLYGKKDLWYTQSIETKNYVAFFILNDPNNSSDPNDGNRKDARQASGTSGGVIGGTNKSRFLKEIRLYSKKDLLNGISNAKPIKVVNFEYDYSLCPLTVNSDASTKGKLTLKRIYFTYGNSQKGKLSPYVFEYADINHDGVVDGDENPSYNQMSVDRWGTYKPNLVGSANNLDFPYTNQIENSDRLNKFSAAWSLTSIKTPAGSNITVNYETDDYGYVQNKDAGQMFKIAGVGSSVAFSAGTVLYGNKYLYVDLSASKTGGILTSVPVAGGLAAAEFVSKYIKELSKIYFKVKMNLDDKGNNEFVPGYADILSFGICDGGDYYQVNGTGPQYHKYAYLEMKEHGIKDNNVGAPFINPIVKAGMQMGRMYLPQIVFPGSAPSSGNATAVKGLVTTIKDAKYLFGKGINKALYERNIAKSMELDASIVRLYNPDNKKIGGGSRVNQVTINDNWNGMSGEANSTYGQVYSYTKSLNGKEISSGVASYEPMQGADENSMRYPVDFAIEKSFAPNDEYFQEEPMGESFFPDPFVGYEKVTVKNLPRTNVITHATGRTEYEFFTAKDFPIVTDRTDLQKQRVKPKLLTSILKFGSVSKLYLSQGYVIKTNDMHGKPKSQKMFAESGTNPISGIIYHYKSKLGSKSIELDSKADVLNPTTNLISQKDIGKTTDFYTDARHSKTNTFNAGVGINIQSATCTYYVPLVFVWPSFGYDRRNFNSYETTKLIQQYGLIDYVEAFENNSTVKTENLIYDDVSGEVILTKTTNDFDAPVYNLKYGAHWGYEDMGAAYQNTGISFAANTIDGAGKIIFNQSFFRPGDEVAIIDKVNNTYIKTWVIDDKQGATGLWLVKDDGQAPTINLPSFNTGTGLVINRIKILRSGRRNMQSLPMASMLSIANPRVGNSIIASQASLVLNSSAVEYSDKWNLICGDKVINTDNNCVCNQLPRASEIFNLTSNMLQTVPFMPQMSPVLGVGFQPYLVGTNPICTNPWYVNSIQFINPAILSFITSNGYDQNFVCSPTFPSGTGPFHYFEGGVIAATPNVLNYTYGQYEGNRCYLQLTIPAGKSWLDYTFVSISNYATYEDCSRKTEFKADLVLHNKNTGLNETFTNISGINCFDLCAGGNNSATVQCGKMVGDVINPYFENIRGNWRVNKSYSYLTDRTQTNLAAPNMNGDIRNDGVYSQFLPFYKHNTFSNKWEPISTYNGTSLKPFDNWIKNNEVDKINEYGNVLQARDVLNRPSSSLYGYNHTLPTAAANNSYYNQLAFDGFEDYNYIKNECSGSLTGNVSTTNSSGYIDHFNYFAHKSHLVSSESHTGRYSIQVPNLYSLTVTRKLTNPSCAGGLDNHLYTIKECDNAGLFGPYYGFSTAQKFVLSVWAKENIIFNRGASLDDKTLTYPHVGVSVSLNGAVITLTAPKKSDIINGWQKLEYEFTVPALTPNVSGPNPFGSISISLNNSGSNSDADGNSGVFYDDLRISPYNSSMKSMVYDPNTLRLIAELDDRNFATFYEYDEEGTLVRIKKETEKGIFTIKESRSGLKK